MVEWREGERGELDGAENGGVEEGDEEGEAGEEGG